MKQKKQGNRSIYMDGLGPLSFLHRASYIPRRAIVQGSYLLLTIQLIDNTGFASTFSGESQAIIRTS